MSHLSSDIDTVLKLEEHGLEFLEECVRDKQTFKRNSNANLIKKYFKLYVDNPEIGGYEKTVHYIINNKFPESLLWRKIRCLLSDSWQTKFILTVLNKIKNYPVTEQIRCHKFLDQFTVVTVEKLISSASLSSSYDLMHLTNYFLESVNKGKETFIDYVSVNLNSNMHMINSDVNEDFDNIEELHQLVYMLNITVMMCNKLSNISDIKLDPRYIEDRSCILKWYTKKYGKDDIILYNSYTKLFFLALDCMRIICCPILNKLSVISYQIEHYEYIHSVQNMINRRLKFYSIIANRLKCEEIDKLYMQFLTETVSTKGVHMFTNDVLLDMITYTQFRLKTDDEYKCEYVPFFLQCIKKTEDSVDSLKINYYNVYSIVELFLMYCQKPNNILPSDMYDEFCKAIVYLVIKLATVDDDDDFENRLTIYLHLTESPMLSKMFTDVPKMDILKFITCVVNDSTELYEQTVDDIKEEEGDNDSYTSLTVNIDLIYELLSVENFKSVVCDPAVYNDVCRVVCMPLNVLKLSVDDEYNCNYTDNNKLSAQGFVTVKTVFDVLQLLKVKTLDVDEEIVDYILEKFVKYVVKHNEVYDITPVLDMLKSDKPLYKEEVPDKFLDPITYLPVNDPVVIPNMDNVIVEKSTMIKLLLNKQENPFTRETLTVDMLEQFNSLEENKQTVAQFKQQFDEWASQNKL